MDRNTVTGLILIFAIFIGFSIFNNSRLNKAFNRVHDSADAMYERGSFDSARAAYYEALRLKPNHPDVLSRLNEIAKVLGDTETARTDSLAVAGEQQAATRTEAQSTAIDSTRFGAFSRAAFGEDEFITLENSKLELRISLKGGRVYSVLLKDYKTWDGKPLVLFSGDSTTFGFNFFTVDNRAIQTNNLYFTPVSSERSFDATASPQTVILRLMASDDRYIEYSYTLEPDRYMVEYDVSFKSMGNIIATNQNSLTLDWRMYVPQQEMGRQNEDNYTSIKYKYYQDDVEGLKLRQSKDLEEVNLTTKLSWVAFVNQFFSSVVITEDQFLNGSVSSLKTPGDDRYLRYFTSELGIPFNAEADQKLNLKLYYGPNHINTLNREGYELEKIVFLGRNIIGWISRYVIIPVFNWLERYFDSYGLIILILTILIKIVLFPLTFKSYQSTAKMAVLKPKVEELAKKFPKKEDALKKQQATMDLYKRAGVNPMGGCLPTLLQFPILFAMFRFFPVSIELRQESFLWATDLSTYDSILNLPFTIPWYGDHVSLFTLLMTASTILTMKMTSQSPGSDQPGMKLMMYMMPVMFMFFLNNFSSGLTYYYFLANILTYLQNIISKRFIDADAVLATLEENKKKPLKKSKWQQRLEQAAKQRGINPPKR